MTFGLRCAAIARRASSLARFAHPGLVATREARRAEMSAEMLFGREARRAEMSAEMLLAKVGYNGMDYPLCSSAAGLDYPLCSSAGQGRAASGFGPIGSDGLPIFVDWREAGAVTKVSNQGKCGACWSFAVTASIEGINFIRTNELIKLSEQQLIDCCDMTCSGCDGGSAYRAFKYIMANRGQVPYANYPYQGCQNQFIRQRRMLYGVTIDNFSFLQNADERILKMLVATQPIVVVVGADESFMKYEVGVLDGKNYTWRELTKKDSKGDCLGHYVVVVGYGETDLGQLFWLIKNSHGLWYGQDGYIMVARETGKPGGAFGITRLILYPMKNSPNNTSCVVRTEFDLYLRGLCKRWVP